MGALKTKSALSSRGRKRSFAESVEFPRWVVGAGIMLIGFMLFLALILNPDGKLRKPGIAEYLFLAAVFAVGVGVAGIDSKWWTAAKQQGAALVDRSRWQRLFMRGSPDVRNSEAAARIEAMHAAKKFPRQ